MPEEHQIVLLVFYKINEQLHLIANYNAITSFEKSGVENYTKAVSCENFLKLYFFALFFAVKISMNHHTRQPFAVTSFNMPKPMSSNQKRSHPSSTAIKNIVEGFWNPAV